MNIYSQKVNEFTLEKQRFDRMVADIDSFYTTPGNYGEDNAHWSRSPYRKHHYPEQYEKYLQLVRMPTLKSDEDINWFGLSFDKRYYSDRINQLINIHKDIMPELLQETRNKKLEQLLS